MGIRFRSLSAVLALGLVAAPSIPTADAAPAKDKAKAKATKAKATKAKAKDKPEAKAKAKRKRRGKPPEVDLAVEDFTLDNGLRVYVIEDHSTPMFAMNLVYDVGSRHEKPGRTGFAHFFEHMMFKGSKNIPDGGHFKYVLGAGGEMNASTSYDFTNYYNVLPSHYLDMALWLESDRMRSLEIDEKAFENQREAVQEEKAMRVDNQPYAKAMEAFTAEVWKGTGYAHPTIGSLEDLEAAKAEDTQEWYERYYNPNNAVLAIVGDVELGEVKAKVQQYFGDIPKGPDLPKPEAVQIDREKKIEARHEDPLARQPAYMISWHTVPSDHPDRYAIELAGNILLRGDSSRITKILKDQKELVVFSVFFPFTLRQVGAAGSLYVPVEGASFDDIKKIVSDELTKVKKRGVSKKELQKAINQKVMDTMGGLSTNLGRALRVGLGALFYDDPKRVLTDLERYQAVTQRDIKRAANKYFTDNWLVLEIVPQG